MHRLSVAIVTIAGLCALAGCGTSGAASPAASPGTATVAGPAMTPTPSALAAPAGGKLVLDEHSNGRIVRVASGTVVTVVLHSTYWHFGPGPAGTVLAAMGPPSPSARPPGGSSCMPGMGCGTVTAVFRAAASGTAVIRASRLSCGEALRCRASQGRFAVTIVVRG